jgi:hypothetical protein
MSDADFKEVRLETAWIQVRRDIKGVILLTWLPHDPDERDNLGGRTFSPGDGDLPNDYPTSDNLDDYLEWATRRWGPSRFGEEMALEGSGGEPQ